MRIGSKWVTFQFWMSYPFKETEMSKKTWHWGGKRLQEGQKKTPACPHNEASFLSQNSWKEHNRPNTGGVIFHYSALSSCALLLFASVLFPPFPFPFSTHSACLVLSFLLLHLLLSLLPLLLRSRSPWWLSFSPASDQNPNQTCHHHTHTYALTRMHTHTCSVPLWRCQRSDESNDRLTSVRRPQLTSPWAAHKQLISALIFPSSRFLFPIWLFPVLPPDLIHLFPPVFIPFVSPPGSK